MFAIIQIGGNQYKVELGTIIQVDKQNGKTGDILRFPSLLVAGEDQVKLSKEAALSTVEAKILRHLQGKKISTLRFKAKSRHRRRKGFRAQLTELEIIAIGGHQPKSQAAKKETPAKPRQIKKTVKQKAKTT